MVTAIAVVARYSASALMPMRPSAFRSDRAVTPTTSDTNTSGTTIIFSAATNTEPATCNRPSTTNIWIQGAAPS